MIQSPVSNVSTEAIVNHWYNIIKYILMYPMSVLRRLLITDMISLIMAAPGAANTAAKISKLDWDGQSRFLKKTRVFRGVTACILHLYFENPTCKRIVPVNQRYSLLYPSCQYSGDCKSLIWNNLLQSLLSHVSTQAIVKHWYDIILCLVSPMSALGRLVDNHCYEMI